MNTKYKLIVMLLPFAVISMLLGYYGWGGDLKSFEPTLVTVTITVAIFAVNFAFLEYQFSPYRSVMRAVSTRQVLASVSVMILALLPIIILVLNNLWLSTTAIIVIPLVASASVLLSIIARTEANPTVQLYREFSNSAIIDFVKKFAHDVENHLLEIKQMELSKPKDMPMHEWSLRTSPQVRNNDPFNHFASIGHVAIQNADILIFQQVVQRMLEVLRLIHEYKHQDGEIVKGHEVNAVINQHAEQIMTRLAIASYEFDKSGLFAIKFLELCDLFIRKLCIERLQTSKLAFFIMKCMLIVTKPLISKGNSDHALIAVITARQAAQKGIDDSPNGDQFFSLNMVFYPSLIKTLGQEAIKFKDTDYLYRCFDALGWLGCSAIEARDYDVSKSCLQGLVQLGRESRAAKLECFWTHCLIEPSDHAFERIGWMASWVASIEEEKQKFWIELFNEAYSRLCGTTYSMKIEGKDNKKNITLIDSKVPHIFSYSTELVGREVDYSDYSFVKEYDL